MTRRSPRSALARVARPPRSSGTRRRLRRYASSFRRLFELLQLRVDDFSGERQIFAVAHDFRLAFLAQNKAQEFQHCSIHRLALLAIRVSVDPVVERVRTI